MRWKKLLLGGFALVVIAAWAATAVVFLLEFPQGVRYGALFIAAIATEGIFWAAAIVLGVSVVESRQRIWRWMTGRGWTMPEDEAPAEAESEDDEPTSS